MSDGGESENQEENEASDGLLPELELVAQLLAEGRSDAAAGAAVGRSSKYVQRTRRANPAFVARVRSLKERRTEQITAGLGALLEEALDAVRRGLSADKPADQLRAAALVLDRYRTFQLEDEYTSRVQAVEDRLAGLQRRDRGESHVGVEL